MSNESLYDLVIIGAAAAGSAASVYASRRNLKFVVVAKDTGGEVALCGEVENWPGIKHTTGIELSRNFTDHMMSYEPETSIGFLAEKIEQDGNVHVVTAKNFAGETKQFRTKAVIIGTGIHPRELGIDGEADYKGRGVTYCTVCDGPLYKGKITTTIGAGNSALESALMMAELAEKVYLITKYKDEPKTNGGFPKGENILIDKVKAHDNITVIYNAMTTKISGEQMVGSIHYKDIDSGEETSHETNGVMVHIGQIPNSQFVDGVEKNPGGELVVDIGCNTSVPGIFAAGDVTNTPFKQIAISAGMGVTAALSAIDYINRWEA